MLWWWERREAFFGLGDGGTGNGGWMSFGDMVLLLLVREGGLGGEELRIRKWIGKWRGIYVYGYFFIVPNTIVLDLLRSNFYATS